MIKDMHIEMQNGRVCCASNLSLITKEQVQQLADIPLKFNIQFPYTKAKKFHQSTGNGFIDKIITNIRMVRSFGLKLDSCYQNEMPTDVRDIVGIIY